MCHKMRSASYHMYSCHYEILVISGLMFHPSVKMWICFEMKMRKYSWRYHETTWCMQVLYPISMYLHVSASIWRHHHSSVAFVLNKFEPLLNCQWEKETRGIIIWAVSKASNWQNELNTACDFLG